MIISLISIIRTGCAWIFRAANSILTITRRFRRRPGSVYLRLLAQGSEFTFIRGKKIEREKPLDMFAEFEWRVNTRRVDFLIFPS